MNPILLASALSLLAAPHPVRVDSAVAVNLAVWRGIIEGLRKSDGLDSTVSVCIGTSSVSVADLRKPDLSQIHAPPLWVPDSLRHLADAHLSSCWDSFVQGVPDSARRDALLILAGPVMWLGSDSVATSGAYYSRGSLGYSAFILVKRLGKWTIVSGKGIYIDG